MPSVFDDKNAILREISAQKTLVDGFPDLLKRKAMTSLNQKAGELKTKGMQKAKDVIKEKLKSKKASGALKFVQDVMKIIDGAKAIRAIAIATIANDFPKIEKFIKDACKCQLKEMINCGHDPRIPNFLKDTGPGVDIKMRNIDFYGLFHVDPQSEEGKLLYQDPMAAMNSTDMHTFTYEVLQHDSIAPNAPAPFDWGAQTHGMPIMTLTYSSNTPTASNVLNVKASQYYSNNKTLTDFNNDYIDSITILPTAQMFNQIIDSILGCISVKVKLPLWFLKKQEESNRIVEKIIDVAEDIPLDDTFFTFSEYELMDIEEIAKNRSKGIRKFTTCDILPLTASTTVLGNMTNDYNSATTQEGKAQVIHRAFKSIEDEMLANAPKDDEFRIQIEFFDAIFKAIGLTISNTILSPKLAMLFTLNHRIIYGNNAPEFNDAKDYIFHNRVLFRAIMNVIYTILIAILMKYVTKKIAELVAKHKAADLAEVIKAYKEQMISLIIGSPAVMKIMTKFNQANVRLSSMGV